MKSFYQIYISFLLFIALLIPSKYVWAHGYFKERFFPSTITVDEPFVNDKLELNTYRTEAPAENGGDSWTTNPQLTYAKTLTKKLQISVTESYLHIKNPGQDAKNGFDNTSVGLRYNVFKFDDAESIFSVGLNSSLGGTGSSSVNTASNTSLSPQLLYGQGLKNVPDSVKYLKPFALAFSVSPEMYTNNYNVTSVAVDAAIQYSLPFLQQFVKNFNSSIMNHLVPIVEFPFTICTQGTCSGQTTGTIDPGFIIYNKYGQIGLEAMIPANSNTGSKIGGVLQFYLYLDTIFPKSIGKPIF